MTNLSVHASSSSWSSDSADHHDMATTESPTVPPPTCEQQGCCK